MDRNRKQPIPVIGGSSLLVIFAVLCLTVFALLGLSTVQADKRLSDISVEAVSDYYSADCQAEEIFALLRSGIIPENVRLQGDVYTYHCMISPTQELQVEIRATDWAVLRWQSVSSIRWQEDNTLELWNGNK